MCTDAGLEDRDTSLLTQTVLGYSWTRGDVKSQMEPLLDIHDVDACPHDFTLKFLPRGSSSAGTIVTADFAKNGDGARYKTTQQQDTDLPKLLRVNFSDTGFDQQTNNILSPLPVDVVDSQNDIVIDLTTSADTPDWRAAEGRPLHAAGMERPRHRRAVADRQVPRYRARRRHDARPRRHPVEREAREADIRRRPDGLHLQARRDCTRDPQFVDYGAGDGSARSGDDRHPVARQGFVIDAPYREDSDADIRPLLYSAAGSYAQLAFTSAAIWEETGVGTGAAFDQLFATVSSGATWGLCTAALGTVPSPWMWDRGNTLTVSLQSGSLTSCAEADIDADPTLNLILVGSNARGWEYVNFTTATLNGDGTYTLSGFKRGRRGTEWACSTHGAGEAWLLASSLDVDEMGSDDVGDSLAFKAQSLGRSLDAAPEIDVAPYTGATLKPYAPARIAWAYNGTDLTGTISRRTRVGGAWTGGSTIPISEASEAYEVDVYNGSTFKRTITVTATNVFTYTAAMATADGITLPTAPTVNVYQMSDAVGRGYALAA
jgi:hypothetical protein